MTSSSVFRKHLIFLTLLGLFHLILSTELRGRDRRLILSTEVRGRDRRSDDTDPLNAVVSGLVEKVEQLTAQITSLNNRLSVAEEAVGFTARYKDYEYDITHLGAGQILKFDHVLYNAGNGYSTTTGLFTAPSAGTYAFYMNVAQHSGDDGTCTVVHLMHGSALLLSADACNHYLNTGSNMAVRHLAAGDTVHVQMRSGNKVHDDWHTSFSGMKLSPL